MNHEDYCSYELSKALKAAGFDEPCYFYYTKEDAPDDHVWSTTSEEAPIDYNRSVYAGCSMPLLSQAQKWLREKWRIEVNAIWSFEESAWFAYSSPMNRPQIMCADVSDTSYPTYEQALSEGIKSALELIKKGE